MAGNLYTQDPQERITYALDWGGFLADGEQLGADPDVEVVDYDTGEAFDPAPTVTATAVDGEVVTFQLEGVPEGSLARVTVHATTSTNQAADRSIYVIGRTL